VKDKKQKGVKKKEEEEEPMELQDTWYIDDHPC
jgi:hypothetical protein